MKQNHKKRSYLKSMWWIALAAVPLFALSGCAQVEVPDGRSVSIEPPQQAENRMKAINELRKPIIEVPLQEDVLVPKRNTGEPLPDIFVGPYELRSETLASALQLILADLDTSLAFETEEGFNRRITISNLRGILPDVVAQVCSLADLYCTFENGVMTIKEFETFVVDLPPIAESASSTSSNSDSSSSDSDSDSSSGNVLKNIQTGVQALTTGAVTLDETTRTLIYQASHRAAKQIEKYFEKLRKNTALIVYEIHVWEVALNNDNSTGINWTALVDLDEFTFNFNLPGNAPAVSSGATPISITPNFTGSSTLTSSGVFEFISEFGAVKTVSQPQLTVLSGSSASLSVLRTESFVSAISEEQDETTGNTTSSVTTSTVNDGLTLDVESAWDKSTVYGVLDIQLDQVLDIQTFNPTGSSVVQQPVIQTRSITTQIRVRPGDAVLIAGLVTERDDYDATGPGLLTPWLDTSRSSQTENNELVFLLRPRVIVYTDPNDTKKPEYKILTEMGPDSLLSPESVDHQPANISDLPDMMPLPPTEPLDVRELFSDHDGLVLPESLREEDLAPEAILEPPAPPISGGQL